MADRTTLELARAAIAPPKSPFFGIHATSPGRIFAGGIALKHGDTVVGAIGVSSGTDKQDQHLAEAGARVVS